MNMKKDRRETDEEFRRRAERFAPSICTFRILDKRGKVVFDGPQETLKALESEERRKNDIHPTERHQIQKRLKQLREDFEELLGSRSISFKEVATFKNVMGVYLVYFKEEIIYAGSTNNFNIRFGTDLFHKSTHTLHRKLSKEGKTTQQVKDFLNNNCRYKIKECKDKLEAEALEHLVIWIIKPKYNKYLYQNNGIT